MKKLLLLVTSFFIFSCTAPESKIETQTCSTVIARECRYTYYEDQKPIKVVDWAELQGSALPYREDCQEINTYRYINSFRFATSPTTYYVRDDRYVIRAK